MWKLQRDKINVPHNENLGKDNRSETAARDHHWGETVWIHAAKQHNGCHLYFKANNGEIPKEAKGTPPGIYWPEKSV